MARSAKYVVASQRERAARQDLPTSSSKLAVKVRLENLAESPDLTLEGHTTTGQVDGWLANPKGESLSCASGLPLV